MGLRNRFVKKASRRHAASRNFWYGKDASRRHAASGQDWYGHEEPLCEGCSPQSRRFKTRLVWVYEDIRRRMFDHIYASRHGFAFTI